MSAPDRPGTPGEFEVRRERDGSITVVLDGHPQSHLSLEDPELLAFEYMQHCALVCEALAPHATRFTHVGGAGCTLPRYFTATRPGSTHIVCEPHTRLTEAVREAAPLPRGHRIRIRAQDGATGVAALHPRSAQVVVIDAFVHGRVPASLTTTQFYAHCAAALSEGGLVLHNVADEPSLRYAAAVVASQRAAGLHPVAAVGTSEVLKKRRFGNLVLVAMSRAPSPCDVQEVERALRKCSTPARMRRADAFPTALPFEEPNATRSPEPPDPGRWRCV